MDILKRIAIIKQILALLFRQLALVKGKKRVEDFAEAIKIYEGWFPGSKSYRNNNPGNLRYTQQAGTTGQDPTGFAIFSTYDFGWNALVHQLRIAINGVSQVYNPEMTFQEFFSKYAPSSDNNDPDKYATFVAGRLGLTIQDKIGQIEI